MKMKLLLLLTVIYFCLPNISFGQAPPNLGVVSQFVLFTSNGAVTHTGAGINSHITGDVGSQIGGNSGFGNVDGVMRAGDGVTAAALADLNVVFLDLSTQGPLTLHLPLFGSETINPGMYSVLSPANSTLNGILTLDGNNDPNAYFFFNLGANFSIATNAEIKLINGAKACNVFWLVNGVVDIATGAKVRGNIIANNSAINIASNVLLEGRALSTNGAISVNTGLVATTPIGCGSPILTGALAPILGSTACYAVFSSNGPVDDDFMSMLTGDVGTNLGLTTEYTPLNVAGTIHPIPDVSTGACAVDVGPAYTYLNTLPTDIELLYPADFGHSLVLTPHTYVMNAAVIFTDTLFLNAGGNANAVFVIKINAAFTTGTFSTVVLQNGAQAKNVFWKIDGAVSINDFSVFKGTIVSAGAIVLKTGVKVEGRVLTSAGAINTFSSMVKIPVGTCGLTVMDQTVCEGDSTGFTVTSPGIGLTYRWRKGNVNLINGGNISGVSTATLVINPATLSDAATNYNVIVTGGVPLIDTSDFISLIVTPKTVITLDPVNKTLCSGDSIGFVVKAVGDNLTYQWRKGLVNVVDGAGISGAQNDTLIFNPASALNDATDYNVIVTGTCGKDTSVFVSLTTNATTNITLEPIDKTVCSGDSTAFVVTATGDNLTYQWRKGLVNVTNGAGISGVQNDTLIFKPASALQSGTDYNVVVTGTCGNDTSVSVSLIVNPATLITVDPVDKTVCSGDSTGFTVTATGTGLTYQWKKGNVILIDGGRISGAQTATLSIDPVSTADTAYNYTVIVTGACGKDTSINVSLMVDSAAVIVVQPIDKIVCEGDNVFFSVVATGGNLTYQWRKGTVNIVNGGNISGANTDTLKISAALITDSASNYNVVVTSGCFPVGSILVDLKSADGFGILSGVGISSTGFSVISNMDVGISPGVRSQVTGFPPATVVNGAIYASDDVAPAGVAAMLAQAKLDLLNAYLFAEGATAPAPITVAGDQGGTTLTPGIYKSTSTLLIQSGDLTLDALGDPNAAWIFQIASDFTTIGGAGGNVILAGGAQAKNITWQVGSSATIGNYTSFKGNILALTSITMNTGSSIEGRLLAINGAVVLSGDNLINEPINSSISGTSNVTSVDVSLIVNPKTVITLQPISKMLCAGDSTGFVVTAKGDNLTYQWRKGNVNVVNGAGISGAQNDTLIFDPASTLQNATDYNVIVTGNCGKDTSVFVSLTVNPITLITVEPTNKTICAGDSTAFVVTAVGGNLTYQWRKGNVNVVNGAGISGAQNDTLIFDPASALQNAADYNVIVTGTCGKDTSVFVSLTVNPATLITLEPTNKTICAGDSTGFVVTATGDNLTYQWRKGNVNVVNGAGISGAQNDTLIFNPASALQNANDYNVVVTGACGNDTSVNVSLTVSGATLITIEPTNKTICEGDSTAFVVTATGGNLSYQWRKGNVNVVNGAGISGAQTATLSFDPASTSQIATDYNVIVTGACGKDTSVNVSLIVKASPIAIATTNSPVCLGETILLKADTVTGATYSWTNTTGYTSTNQNPSILSATSAEAGVYSLVVTANGCPSDTSTVVVVVKNCDTIIPITDFFIPEGFSPNGDGINDLFVIRGILNFPNNEFIIYNRWGSKVYEASPYESTWSGNTSAKFKMGGDELPTGTYFYTLDLKDGSKVYKGTIYLSR